MLDSGARGAATAFVARGISDLLIAWESGACRSVQELEPDKPEIVMPSLSILAEPPVTVVDKNVDKHSTLKPATADLGGWRNEQKTHFDDGGVFDQIDAPGLK